MTERFESKVTLHDVGMDDRLVGMAQSLVAHDVLHKALSAGRATVEVSVREPQRRVGTDTEADVKGSLWDVWAFGWCE